ncbi:MAG: S8 family serine peptidase [Coriobacteriia bacterium]|nr:S8 family serine peptidase [Coriobacteriia bacterium]
MKAAFRKALSVVVSLTMVCCLTPTASFAGQTAGSDAVVQAVQATPYYGEPGVDYEPGEVLVLVDGTADSLAAEAGAGGFSALGSQLNVNGVSFSIQENLTSVSRSAVAETLGAEEGAGEGASLLSSPTDDILLLSTDDTPALIDALSALECVVYAQPNYYYEAYTADDQALQQAYGAAATAASAAAEPAEASIQGSTTPTEEPFFQYQWGLSNTIDVNSREYRSLNVEAAWANGAIQTSADNPVVVAVVDSGVDYTHEDLKDSMWDKGLDYPQLTALGGGMYGIDTTDDEQGSTDPMDTYVGHGTHCASVIASAWNDVGIAGINGNAEIMAVRFLGNKSKTEGAVKAYEYLTTAKQAGVNVCVASNSWGPTASGQPTDNIMNVVVTNAGEAGIISVFAAGNAGANHDSGLGEMMCQGNPYLIYVGAFTSDARPAVFTDYGMQAVDVFSPGTRILAATTTSDKVSTMPPQYIPWATDVNPDGTLKPTTYFMDTYEGSAETTFDLFLVNDATQVHTLVAQNVGELDTSGIGYVSDGRMNVALSKAVDAGMKAGDTFAIRVTIPASAVGKVAASDAENVYLAYTGGYTNRAMGMLYLMTQGAGWTSQSQGLANRDGNWSMYSWSTSKSSFMGNLNSDGSYSMLFQGTLPEDAQDTTVYFDNIALGSEPAPYYYSDGTSMACPGVSGVTSLLAAAAGQALSGDGAAAAAARDRGLHQGRRHPRGHAGGQVQHPGPGGRGRVLPRLRGERRSHDVSRDGFPDRQRRRHHHVEWLLLWQHKGNSELQRRSA